MGQQEQRHSRVSSVMDTRVVTEPSGALVSIHHTGKGTGACAGQRLMPWPRVGYCPSRIDVQALLYALAGRVSGWLSACACGLRPMDMAHKAETRPANRDV